jgi:hypothetical protein
MAFVALRGRAAMKLPVVSQTVPSLGSKRLILKWIGQIQ